MNEIVRKTYIFTITFLNACSGRSVVPVDFENSLRFIAGTVMDRAAISDSRAFGRRLPNVDRKIYGVR